MHELSYLCAGFEGSCMPSVSNLEKIKMKKTIFTVLFAACCMTQMQAQELFHKVYDVSIGVVNNPNSNDEQIQINQFKVTVLNYITAQVQQRGLQKDGYFYDSQAVNLHSFILDFLDNVTKGRSISQAKRLAVIKCYQEASLQNPLFNDKNRERTHCYINDTKTLTPFSLDTDWEKAYEQATRNIKTVLAR